MNTPQQSQETAATPPAAEPTGTFDQRLNALQEQIRSESTPEPAGEPEGENGSPPPASSAETGSPVGSAADKATERRARLKALQNREREAVERKTKQQESARLVKELEAERQARAAVEAKAAKLVDLDSLDEAAFFRLAQTKGIRPDKLGEWIREAIANPERVAEVAAQEAARKAVDPHISKLEQRLAAAERALEAERQMRAQAHNQAVEAQAAQEFFSYAESNAEQAPFASAFLNQHGRDEFYKVAVGAAQHLPPGAGWQAVLDLIEDNLSQLAPIYGAKPAKASAPSPKSKAAAAKANTVSNSLAQERASVVEDDDWSSIPFEERVARLRSAAR